jgi:hypothetical protein
MSFDKIVEALIKEAQARGEFDNLPGEGKPIDLTAYFETPEEVRLAQSLLKNAGMISPEVQLLKEIAELRQVQETVHVDDIGMSLPDHSAVRSHHAGKLQEILQETVL